MWIADSDFQAPNEVIEALRKRLEHPCFGYPADEQSFNEAAAGWEQRRFGWEVKPEWVVYGGGVMPFIMLAIRAFSAPGDQVIIQSPVYPPFHDIVRNNGRQLITNSLIIRDNGSYEVDFIDLEEKLSQSRTKLLIMCNPHNPVMKSYTKDELKKIGDLCIKHGVFVVSDEVHGDMVFGGRSHIPFGSLGEKYADNSMVLINPSKTFNVAGFYIGAAVIPNKARREAVEVQIKNNKDYSRPIFSTTAFVAAYTKCDDYADEVKKYIESNAEFAVNFIRERLSPIRIGSVEATFLLWLDCRELHMEQTELCDFFLKAAKLKLNDGKTFGPEGVGFMRMNIACPRSVLVDALNRIEKALKGGTEGKT